MSGTAEREAKSPTAGGCPSRVATDIRPVERHALRVRDLFALITIAGAWFGALPYPPALAAAGWVILCLSLLGMRKD